MKKNVFLYMSHVDCKETLNEFSKITKATKELGDCYLFFHLMGKATSKLSKLKKFLFTDEDIHRVYRRDKVLKPSNLHLPVLLFFLKNPFYKYYWLIEYDVRFTGDWHQFFKYFDNSNADLISSRVRNYADIPKWPNWKLKHPTKKIPLQQRYSSFNPIYRISKRALKLIDQKQRDGWKGHFETLLATLLYHNNFILQDFGGNGKFVNPEDKNRFYLNKTLRWRPVFKKIGNIDQKLYHPLKPPNSPVFKY